MAGSDILTTACHTAEVHQAGGDDDDREYDDYGDVDDDDNGWWGGLWHSNYHLPHSCSQAPDMPRHCLPLASFSGLSCCPDH